MSIKMCIALPTEICNVSRHLEIGGNNFVNDSKIKQRWHSKLLSHIVLVLHEKDPSHLLLFLMENLYHVPPVLNKDVSNPTAK